MSVYSWNPDMEIKDLVCNFSPRYQASFTKAHLGQVPQAHALYF